MRIGYSQTRRARMLGVETNTVQNWDREAVPRYPTLGNETGPTHADGGRG